MRWFFQKLFEWLRKFFVILFEDAKERDVQTQIPIYEQQQEIARPVELGISSSEKPKY